METDRKVVIREQCAWCKKITKEGDQLVPVSDVICDECKESVRKEIKALEKED